jgi:Na+-driven multidrug efflux pump
MISIVLNIFAILIVIVFAFIFNESISRLFTNDEEVVVIVYNVLWVLLVYVFFDALHGVMSGIIRGLGR